jgi:hypothetical protein
MAFKKEFMSALRDIGEMSYEERNKLAETNPWPKRIGIAILIIFAIAVFTHPTGGAG